MSNPRPAERLSAYTSIPLEILISLLSLLPVLLLVYFYPSLPERVPVFLNLRGEVQVWAAKSVLSVFRLPLMAIDLQAICLLMKYGMVRSQPVVDDEAHSPDRQRTTALGARLWDWLRLFTAIKMCAESLDPLFLGDGRLLYLRTPARAVSWAAVILGAAGALLYLYRLMALRRKMKESGGERGLERGVDRRHLRGIFYYNPGDHRLFVDKYLLNFANKWAYVLLACLAAYPLLVFWSV